MESPLSRRARERQLRRKAMIEAAQAVFAEKGYAHATLDEIAARAEFGKGTLYNYFEGGKEGILLAVVESIHDDLCRMARQAFFESGARPFQQAFHDFVQRCFAYYLRRQDLFLIVVKEVYRMTFSDDEAQAGFLKEQRARLVNILVAAVEAAIEAGELRPLPPALLATTMLGNINGFQMHLCLEGRNARCAPASSVTPGEAAHLLTTVLFDGLAAVPRPTPE